MYNYVVLPEMIGELELLAMPRESMILLKDLLDDVISADISKFFDRVDADFKFKDDVRKGKEYAVMLDQKINQLREILETDVLRQSIHLKFRESGEFKQLNDVTLFSYRRMTVLEQQVLKNKIDKFLNINERVNLSRTVNVRSSNAYLYFKQSLDEWQLAILETVQLLEKKRIPVPVPECGNLLAYFENNKMKFFAQNEKARTTGLGGVLSRLNVLRVVSYAINFRINNPGASWRYV